MADSSGGTGSFRALCLQTILLVPFLVHQNENPFPISGEARSLQGKLCVFPLNLSPNHHRVLHKNASYGLCRNHYTKGIVRILGISNEKRALAITPTGSLMWCKLVLRHHPLNECKGRCCETSGEGSPNSNILHRHSLPSASFKLLLAACPIGV